MDNVEKYIPGYEGRYVVSTFGYVRKVGKERRNYGTLNNRNDLIVGITDNTGKRRWFSMSRLVAEVFIPNPDGRTQVDHIDTNRMNNRVDNLRWTWPRENIWNFKTSIHRKEPRLFARQRVNRRPVKATLDSGEILYANSMKRMAEILGCSECTVSRCAYGDQPLLRGSIRIELLPKESQLQLPLL